MGDQQSDVVNGGEKDVTIKTTSPAYNRQRIEGDNTLIELPWIGKINLRGNAENKRFIEKVAAVVGCALPVEANTQEQHKSITVFWLGPDEWLIHCEIDAVAELMEKIKSDLSSIHHAVTDVSDYYTVLQLQGPDVTALLRKGCPLDLHPEVFKSSHCTQTRFGHASVLLHKLDKSTFNIQIRWSYTEYLWDYLVSAMDAIDR
ncbi:MAG: hypothetical protein GKR96_08200 [Gammaproteobacteria bacterium]|nr:hypothetical protein [Gammaproteobacteria bacterium]